MDVKHRIWEDRALDLARGALGRTSPNPAVGAVLVRDGVVVGEGATQPPGGPHAEIVALRAAGTQARGATLYVTLEPCNHYGRTPPCADALLAAGVAAVHYATPDPHPAASGGADTLRAAGVRVTPGTGRWNADARRLNEAFFHWAAVGRPFVIAKWAMSLDGKIATRTGESRWITGEEARRRVHALRDTVAVILVGSATVLADDPALTTRLDGRAGHHPLRVVLDGRGRVPVTARVVAGHLPGQTLIVTTTASSPAWRTSLARDGVEVAVLPRGRAGGVDLASVLALLGARHLTSVLVEGGARTLAAFAEVGLIDKYLVFAAPLVIGGVDAPGPIGGVGPALLHDARRLRLESVERVGADALLTCYPRT
jgi:diaminohydroxyphosphoribosylaminopyrimidine deaminase/5-amino-6-(5-phosphoribosylamino)uracil reductase